MPNDLDQLEEKLRTIETSKAKKTIYSPADAEEDSHRAGMQAGLEFVGSIAAGTIIGLALDKWLDTIPLFLLIFFFLGMGTGFYNVYRVTNNLGGTVGFSRLHQSKKDAKTSSDSK